MGGWMGIGPQMFGFGTAGPGGQTGAGGSAPESSGVSNTVMTPGAANPPLWSPDNPLFWFGLILAATAGLLTVSTSIDAGPLRGKASV
jgi:hypothetical protein